jgi:hypothetical protein
MDETCSTHGRIRSAYKILVWLPEAKRPLERSDYRWEGNINMYTKAIGCVLIGNNCSVTWVILAWLRRWQVPKLYFQSPFVSLDRGGGLGGWCFLEYDYIRFLKFIWGRVLALKQVRMHKSVMRFLRVDSGYRITYSNRNNMRKEHVRTCLWTQGYYQSKWIKHLGWMSENWILNLLCQYKPKRYVSGNIFWS